MAPVRTQAVITTIATVALLLLGAGLAVASGSEHRDPAQIVIASDRPVEAAPAAPVAAVPDTRSATPTVEATAPRVVTTPPSGAEKPEKGPRKDGKDKDREGDRDKDRDRDDDHETVRPPIRDEDDDHDDDHESRATTPTPDGDSRD